MHRSQPNRPRVDLVPHPSITNTTFAQLCQAWTVRGHTLPPPYPCQSQSQSHRPYAPPTLRLPARCLVRACPGHPRLHRLRPSCIPYGYQFQHLISCASSAAAVCLSHICSPLLPVPLLACERIRGRCLHVATRIVHCPSRRGFRDLTLSCAVAFHQSRWLP